MPLLFRVAADSDELEDTMNIKIDESYLIELNGVPGCGKTTIVNELIEVFRLQGVNIMTLKDVYFYKEKMKYSKILHLLYALFSIRVLAVNINVIKFLFCFKFNVSRLMDALRLIKLYFQLIRVYENKKNILLLEEGILQYTASIPYLDSIKDNDSVARLISSMLQPIDKVLIVNCEIDIKESLKRIKERGLKAPEFKQRRFDALDEKECISALEKNYDNLNKLRHLCKNKEHISIFMNADSKHNAKIIFEKWISSSLK